MQKSESILSHAYLREILHYSIITGNFHWLKTPAKNIKISNVAGAKSYNGYRQIQINGMLHYAHRLAWFWVTGEWPEKMIDHKDGVRDANQWLNLRGATRSQNGCNKGKPLNNTSGFKGVNWDKKYQKWRVRIKLNNKEKHLGYFDNIDEAYEKRLKAEKEFFGEFIRH